MGDLLQRSMLQEEYQHQLLGWVKDKVGEGLSVLRKEKGYNEIQNALNYINGEQYPIRSKTISRVVDNRIKKIVLEVVGALTDVRPIWSYETNVDQYKKQAEILNKLARSWWRNSRADRKLQSALTFACAGGSGYVALVWNAELPGGGDFELIPYDPRDVVPIGAVYSDSIQDWQGVCLRQRLAIEEVQKLFPTKASFIGAERGSWFGNVDSKGGKMLDVVSTLWNIMKGTEKNEGEHLPGTVDVMRIYYKDHSIHTGEEPKLMGPMDANWSYIVYPVGSIHPQDGHIVSEEEARLYPRGRLIVCTQTCLLSDTPNPYWHGLFPVVRFTLDPLPWSILGAPLVPDLIPLQNALNEGLRGVEDGIGQWIRRGVIAPSNALSTANLNAIDTRKSGMKLLTNPGNRDSVTLVDGPDFPQWMMESLGFYISQMDENSGVRGLQQLTQLKQMPAADTMEKYMDALSPLLKLRARSIETSLGEIAEMFKVGVFQYFTMERRVQALGQDGTSIEDFDYDPSNMIPATIAGGTREKRAEKHMRNFSFSVAPNSFLNVSHSAQKMILMQMAREGFLDVYSLWEGMDLPNIGPIPAETIPDRLVHARRSGLQPGPTPELVQVQQAAAMVQAQAAIQQVEQAQALAGMQMGAGGGSNLPPGPPGASAQPGENMSLRGPGRPPSGAAPPQMVMKDGGSRMVVSESGR